MLYDRWAQVAASRHREVALRDVAAGRQWTFGELFAAGHASPSPIARSVHPQGNGAGFILEVLRGWRHDALVCPLEAGQVPPACSPPPAGIVHLKTTSATTGAPRWVAFTAAQLAADADNIVATMGLRPDWPNLGVISLAHSYGFSNLVTPLLLHGVPLIVGVASLPEAVRQAGAGEPALTLPAVPALWRAWQEASAIPANVRLAISAGAPLPLELEEAIFAASGLKLHNFYGASECGGIAYDASAQPRADATCLGTPMQSVALSLSEAGCLVVRSPAVGESYWPTPEAALAHGRFQTSDLAELRAGAVWLRGRLGDLINVAGRKVAPETIEHALRQHPAVDDCAVLGLPTDDATRSEQVAAVVVRRGETDAAGLRDFLQGRLPAWQVPRVWRFVASLPVNQRGKRSRAALRRDLWEQD